MKKIISAILIAMCLTMIFNSCKKNTGDGGGTTPPITTTEGLNKPDGFEFITPSSASNVKFVYNTGADLAEKTAIEEFKSALDTALGVQLEAVDDNAQATSLELIVGEADRQEYTELYPTLKTDEFAIKAVFADDVKRVVIAYNSAAARRVAFEYFNDFFVSSFGCIIPEDTNVKLPAIITASVGGRDPAILYVEATNTYYMYTTGWKCYKSKTLGGNWTKVDMKVNPGDDEVANAEGHRWAPEVHKYNGYYYMFTTYMIDKAQNKRGCAVLRSASPSGPFSVISYNESNGTSASNPGVITANTHSAIDGTLYVDDAGQPWMIYCHEWVTAANKVGTMKAVKLSNDLTHFVSEPVELFKANDPSWSKGVITDGCFIYKTQDGQLLMLWSNTGVGGYVLAVARSASGKVEGPWTQDGLIFSKLISGSYNGGHGMIFTAHDGQMYISLHAPNETTSGRDPKPVFIPVVEKNNSLVWGYKK